LITLHLKPSHESRIKSGHLWAFAGEIAESLKGLQPGDGVALCESRGALLGRGYVNPHSLIAVRLLSRGEEPFDDQLFHRRIKDALNYRESVLPGEEAYRLIYSESDGLPGLVVDRYGDHLILQSLTAGIETRLEQIVSALIDITKPASIYLKGISPFRRMEGLPEEDRRLYSETPENIVFRFDGCLFTARPLQGQKSGYYLDQRWNRRLLSPMVADKEVLDLYSYIGSWGISALKAGAREAVMVDSSAKAVEWGMEDAALNGVADRAVFVEADAGDFLKEAASTNRRWDVIVVDPPALISNRQAMQKGAGAYLAINRAALRVLAPGGMLVTCSCSHLLTREKHLEIIGRAAIQEGRRIKVAAVGGHSPDHPILPGHPETEYLKCWILMTNE